MGHLLRRRGRRGLLVALLVVAAGLGGAWTSASAMAQRDADQARNTFDTAGNRIAHSLALALQREGDLIRSAAVMTQHDPNLSNAEFNHWTADIEAFDRHPELLGVGFLKVVPRKDLVAFAERAEADPVTFAPFVMPQSHSDAFCFFAAYASRPGVRPMSPGVDLCHPGMPDSDALAHSRDTGEGVYKPGRLDGPPVVVAQTPLYHEGARIGTVAERRAALIGWIGTAIAPDAMLSAAVNRADDVVVELSYRDTGRGASFLSAPIPERHEILSFNVEQGWVATVYGLPIRSGVTSNASAVAMLSIGGLLSLVLGAFVVVVVTGKARAERLVLERTDELHHLAMHDALTGLANRALIADRADQLLARSRRQRTGHAALYLDLDGFKAVNDTLGHDAGDRLLRLVAARLRSALREADTIGRMGGDEFVILIDGATLGVAPVLVAERILEVMRQPFELVPGQPVVHLSTSIGIATSDVATGEELLRDADVAMYEAKTSGRDAYVVFLPEMQSAIQEALDLELDLRSALDNDQFRLLYQPVYDLTDLTPTGVEALLRWEHPVHGTVMPNVFIPILERTGWIVDVGRWVLIEACRQMAAWHSMDLPRAISVNLSARQLESDAIVTDVRDAVVLSGLDPASLTIEITESALMMDITTSARRLAAIKALGVNIAIDDFGTGYSSLAYLRQLPVDSLKIDRSFISNVDSPDARALVRTIVQLSRDLGLSTVAEGIETTEQLDQLRGDHVDAAQGFLFARPLDAASAEAAMLMAGDAHLRS